MSARALRRAAVALACAGALAACQTPPPPTVSIAGLYARPAEHALVDGIRQYEAGEFDHAETSLHLALDQKLADPRDMAVAYKYLAFIACAFNRTADCALDFTNAFHADPAFRLNQTEIGHPLWGPVYQRVAQATGHADTAPAPDHAR